MYSGLMVAVLLDLHRANCQRLKSWQALARAASVMNRARSWLRMEGRDERRTEKGCQGRRQEG